MSTYYIKKKLRYKRHFICLDCRKGFKQPNEKDLSEKNGDYSLLMNAFYYFKKKKKISKEVVEYLKSEYFEKEIVCPQCQKPMLEVSMSFEVPPKKNLKKWSLHSFYKVNGYLSSPDLPEKKKDLIALLEECLESAICRAKSIDTYKRPKETLFDARKRTNEQIEVLRKEIKKLKSE